jgi:hypothetical protein
MYLNYMKINNRSLSLSTNASSRNTVSFIYVRYATFGMRINEKGKPLLLVELCGKSILFIQMINDQGILLLT